MKNQASMYYGLTPERIDAATRVHNTVFFDKDLNPVQPQEGQWFCEFEVVIPEEGDNFVRDQSLVEYVGGGEVAAEDDEFSREPHFDILILQA
jgi:hypothetical protein